MLYFPYMSQLATVTSKRQLTIPASIFYDLNLKKGQKVVVSKKDGAIVIEPALSLVDRLAGSVKIPSKFKGMSLEEVIKKAKKEHFGK